jgi:hypothetical protein
MSYALYDFTESLASCRRDDGESAIQNAELVRCVAAWGQNGDYSEWSGGFLVELKSGRFAYLTGWCDTTGWGCQDGASCTFFDAPPPLESLNKTDSNVVTDEGESADWDLEPADLNKWIADGCPEERAW